MGRERKDQQPIGNMGHVAIDMETLCNNSINLVRYSRANKPNAVYPFRRTKKPNTVYPI